MADSAADSPPDGPVMTEPDISLHRAGLLPAAADGAPALPLQLPSWLDGFGDGPLHTEPDDRDYTDAKLEAFRARVDIVMATDRLRAHSPETRRMEQAPGNGVLQPAGEPCPVERHSAAVEQACLRDLARTRPPRESRSAGAYLTQFAHSRPCRGEEPDPEGA